ncbi:hypothetical protein N9M66_00200 [Litoreibacter sp.]|nr:hypothetical protein [Litoreibacter sp.]
MFNSLANMIFDAQRKNQSPNSAEAHDPHRRGVITCPRATRRDGASYVPIIRTFW